VSGDSGPFIDDVGQIDEGLLASLAAADADIVCVALGNPKQEKFIQTYRERLGAPVMIGIGGTLDFIVGGRRRAPRWIQRIGLEWVFRAAQEPGRLGRRYLHDGRVFVPRLAGYVRMIRRYRSQAQALKYDVVGKVVLVTTSASSSDSGGHWQQGVDVVANAGSLRIDLGLTARLSMRSICELVGLVRVARRVGAPLNICPLSASVTTQLHSLGIALYLPVAEVTG
jgi:N-acetylglucosaminyldiphosphoundecaprenol N-acetyl-beta-D-mannosaminyltransferase